MDPLVYKDDYILYDTNQIINKIDIYGKPFYLKNLRFKTWDLFEIPLFNGCKYCNNSLILDFIKDNIKQPKDMLNKTLKTKYNNIIKSIIDRNINSLFNWINLSGIAFNLKFSDYMVFDFDFNNENENDSFIFNNKLTFKNWLIKSNLINLTKITVTRRGFHIWIKKPYYSDKDKYNSKTIKSLFNYYLKKLSIKMNVQVTDLNKKYPYDIDIFYNRNKDVYMPLPDSIIYINVDDNDYQQVYYHYLNENENIPIISIEDFRDFLLNIKIPNIMFIINDIVIDIIENDIDFPTMNMRINSYNKLIPIKKSNLITTTTNKNINIFSISQIIKIVNDFEILSGYIYIHNNKSTTNMKLLIHNVNHDTNPYNYLNGMFFIKRFIYNPCYNNINYRNKVSNLNFIDHIKSVIINKWNLTTKANQSLSKKVIRFNTNFSVSILELILNFNKIIDLDKNLFTSIHYSDKNIDDDMKWLLDFLNENDDININENVIQNVIQTDNENVIQTVIQTDNENVISINTDDINIIDSVFNINQNKIDPHDDIRWFLDDLK